MEEKKKTEDEDVIRLMKEKDKSSLEISSLKQALEITKKTYELHSLEMENKANSAQSEFEERLKELETLLADSRNKVKDLEASSESKFQRWNKKEHSCQSFMDFQFGALRVGLS